MGPLNFRQVHLDFHTSEAIQGIGKDFDKQQFQEMLRLGHVNSVTVFSKCHHGWAYHPSTANEMHPHLNFDLLGTQIEAAHEIGVKTPVYFSAGVDEKIASRHPEWLVALKEKIEHVLPRFNQICFNTPYLDYLLKQIEEVLKRYDADGIFLDIVGVRVCYCDACLEKIASMGKSPDDLEAMQEMWENTYKNYTDSVKALVDKYKPGIPIFHNGGHIRRGRRDLAHMNTHLELESLPTGGWGYQHFPLSARYAQGLGMEYLGMTGKFHNTWGEFGGYKHPNALRFETALNIANGAKCSVGDQLHPEGVMDLATYKLIGAAYSEVEDKEPWCDGVESVADIAILSTQAAQGDDSKGSGSDDGCVKIMLEGKYLFDVVDLESDFSKYKVVILPDVIRIDVKLKSILDEFVDGGGKILATGMSGLDSDNDEFAYDFGVKYIKENEFEPSYFAPEFKPQSLERAPFIMYGKAQHVELSGGNELGALQNPYFNRTAEHFCSHQHTPSTLTRFAPGMIEGKSGIYIAWNIFEQYNSVGALMYKEMALYALDRLLGDDKTLKTNLPAQGVVTLMHQKAENRFVQHSLYASPVRRGVFNSRPIEVIEDIVPIYNTEVQLKLDKDIKKVYLAPVMKEIEFTQTDGIISYKIDIFECHQMVVLEY